MKKHYTYEDVVAEFHRVRATYPTHAAAAGALELSPQYFSDLVKGSRRISDAVAEKLGFHKNQDTYSKGPVAQLDRAAVS